MRNKTKLFLSWITSHKVWSVIILILILIIAWYTLLKPKNIVIPVFVSANLGNVKEEVSVTGNVKPLSDVSLAFERGGKVDNIFVAVNDRVYIGQPLAQISNADLLANLDQAKANLRIAEIQLGDTVNDQNQPIIQNSKVDKARLNLTQAQTSLISTIKDSFTKADDAVRNKMYTLFTEPNKYLAKLSFPAENSLKTQIEKGKDSMVDLLNLWYTSFTNLSSNSDLAGYYNTARANLLTIKSLLDKCAEAINNFTPDTVYYTQAQVDVWKANISTARTSIDAAISTLTSANDLYQSTVLALKVSQDDFSTQGATVDQARAGVASAEAELAKSVIKSPITGVVTNLDAKVGEIVSANKNILSVISYGDYEVESFVPEADIAKIKIENMASTTLDAYGNNVNFDTRVIKIDPASTVIDGVPTYKVTLKFINQDERIKSGMTANINILTLEKNNVITIPARAVYTKDNDKYVKILDLNNQPQETLVMVGIRGVNGEVQVISGVKVGDKVVTSL